MNLINLYPGMVRMLRPTMIIVLMSNCAWQADNSNGNIILQVFITVQQYILEPRLVISMRQYHAELLSESDMAT